MDGVALPLVGSNEVAVFKNSRDIEFHCRGEYIEGEYSASPTHTFLHDVCKKFNKNKVP